MWRLPAQLLDDLVARHVRRMLSRHEAHLTDPEALAVMLRDLRPHDAATLFPAPEPLAPGEAVLVADRRRWGADHVRFRMPSARHGPFPENQTISGRLLRPAGGAARDGVVIVVHPWIGPGGVVWLRKFGKPLLRRGLSVASPELPHHFHRTAPGQMSGELAVCGDLVQMLEATLQSVADLRRVAAWLRGQGFDRIAVLGYSLGGWATALLAAAQPGLEAVAVCVPSVDPVDSLRRSPLTAGSIRRDLKASGVPADLFEEFGRLVSPLSFAPTLAANRLLVVGARHDRLLAPEGFERLATHWGCDLWWEPHGHITLFESRGFRRRVASWLSERMAA